ncbi:C4-dicarboxylate ABC transporter substrate-binding protein [Criibacterium bergeronii]|uniref:C4-dicarboxylate ABC transporter substrate-binding protein n=3 Tax=Criibacterium bergeronii TaxID=1871336 RepID=A0A552VB65_9FIRM|nr:C4-dicarboxylate TRAP transporter substrate-binding protein [Criibacterium bergeronii]MBS6062804.1 C4-dicarboxylate TRAP transporter substrate-binding protein [Peptostreptococcaceae bacterium]TRW27723.1 C4-dicarboxylate ABC transporter substrate-binding protein [Criibacterium bergeronii]
MKKRKLLSLFLMSAMLLSACGQKPAEAPNKPESSGGDAAAKDDYKIVLKLSHVFAPEEQLTKSIDKAAKAIYDRTNGAVEIQTYPQAQLPTYKDGLEQVYNKANFISVEDPSYLGDYVPDFKALVGPFLYSDIDQYSKVIQSDLVKDMVKKAEEEKGIKVLALDYVFGFRNMMTNKKIVEPEDLAGMKIRTPGSQIFIDTINSMGATATPMAFSETISAVQQGVVDGLEGTVDAMTANGSAEVVKNVGLTKHFLGTCGVYISKEVFDSIPAEYQTIMQEEFDKNAKEMIELVKTNYDSQVKSLEEKGIEFNEVDLPKFKERAKSVFDKMEGITPGIYEKLVEEIEK